MSGLFKIIPPPDFKVGKHSKDGVFFVVSNVKTLIPFSITLFDVPPGYTDEEYSLKLEDKKFRQDYPKLIEKEPRGRRTTVIEDRKRFVNDIPSSEYIYKVEKLEFKGKQIIFVKNRKIFFVEFSINSLLYPGLEEDVEIALRTLKIQ